MNEPCVHLMRRLVLLCRVRSVTGEAVLCQWRGGQPLAEVPIAGRFTTGYPVLLQRHVDTFVYNDDSGVFMVKPPACRPHGQRA